MAEKMTCVILGAVPEDADLIREYTKNAFVICADGGLDTALKNNIRPDLIVGDFDSAETDIPEGIETIRLPVHKDDTDMLFAVKEGFRRGCQNFFLLGALGGERFDHSIANLCVLDFISANGGKGAIISKGCQVFLLSSGKLILREQKGSIVSVFPFGVPSCNVSYHGLEYPLTHYSLQVGIPLGVSNSIVEDHAEIILHEGKMLVIVEPKAQL